MATKLDTGISAGHRGLERMAAPQLVIDTRRRGPLSPEELASTAQKVQEKRNPASGVAPDWAITGVTSDAEIKSRAGQLAYSLAASAQLVASVLFLERRVAQLEDAARNSGAPHHRNVEKR
jgi:hypothetical protein